MTMKKKYLAVFMMATALTLTACGEKDTAGDSQQAEEQKKTVLEAFPESEMAEEYRILAKAILMKVREKQEVSNA